MGKNAAFILLMVMNIKIRLLNSINPFIFVNPFTNTVILIAPFNVTMKYEYNNDYLISRIVTKVWGTNRGSEWIYSYDYVPGHFENREITNPIDSVEYEIVQFEGRHKGTLAKEILGDYTDKKWSDLWYVFIPEGFTKTLAQMTDIERENRNAEHVEDSSFSKFAKWYKNNK